VKLLHICIYFEKEHVYAYEQIHIYIHILRKHTCMYVYRKGTHICIYIEQEHICVHRSRKKIHICIYIYIYIYIHTRTHTHTHIYKVPSTKYQAILGLRMCMALSLSARYLIYIYNIYIYKVPYRYL